MYCDDSSALHTLDRVLFFVEEGWQTPALEAVKETVEELTAKGLDADGEAFLIWSPASTYSPTQRKRREGLQLQTEIKDMTVVGDLMGSLGVRRITGRPMLSVAHEAEDKQNVKMHGQMYHPKWRYHHKVLAVGSRAAEAIRASIRETWRIFT